MSPNIFVQFERSLKGSSLMTAKPKIHHVNLTKWTALFQEQASSGLTVKGWCAQNNISIHKCNYWKRLVKKMYVDSVLPDIVPIAPGPLPSLSPDPSTLIRLNCTIRAIHA